MFSLFGKKPKSPEEPYLIPELLTLEEAYQGVLIYGATGSGKTSGPGQHIAISLLKIGTQDGQETRDSSARGQI
jgi:hypothetical protein